MVSADIVAAGGGHTSLVARNYLPKAGLGAAAVNRSGVVSGAWVTDDIPRGVKASAELVSLLRGPEAEDLLRRLLFYSAEELLDEYFESDEVKAAFANESVIGHFSGPSAPGTAFTLAHNLLGNIDGQVGGWGLVLGGMGALPDALAAAARARGVEILLRSPVERIRVHEGLAVGVRLEGGRTIDAKAVVSTADPKRTFLQMVEPDDVPVEFRRAVGAIKMHGAAMKVNCALSQLPRWSAADQTPGPQHRGSTYIGPSIDYVEAAFLDAKYGRPSEHPWLEVVTQSVLDPSVAPPGKHTLSIYVQYSPYHLAAGSWAELREPYGGRVITTLSDYAPTLPKAAPARNAITPLAPERPFPLTGAHPSHAEMGPDQFFSFRPVPGWSNYRTPVQGLYLCGAGTHPGGGGSGAPGYNGAHALLADWPKLKAH